MRLDHKALAVSLGILAGGSVLLIGLIGLAAPGYGEDVLETLAGIYPGFQETGGVGNLIVGTLYAALDGAIAGWIIAWLYNRFVGSSAS